MLTSVNEGKGLIKTEWSAVRERVAKVAPEFAKIVDSLSPDKSFPLYLAYYPYGETIGDTETFFLPKTDGGSYKLTDPDAPKEVVKHLGYGINDSPLGMVLEKQFEQFMDLENDLVTIPWSVYKPGSLVSLRRNLKKRDKRVYAPNGILTAISGTRSSFVLPSIGCVVNHSNLQRDFNIKSPAPKSYYEHFNIFKEIYNSPLVDSNWHACLIYFSEKWITKLLTDKSWLEFKAFLHAFAWSHFEYEINRTQYDFVYSLIQKKRNLKANPYLVDTARHLFATAIGYAPGYAPATDDSAMPLTLFQHMLTESYGLKKYFPTILCPTHFSFENNNLPVYYSLQYPSTPIFSPKSRKASSTLQELHELEHIMNVFVDELSKNKAICHDTILSNIAKNNEFKFFHNEHDRHNVIKPSSDIVLSDDRFYPSSKQTAENKAQFACDGSFVRGCISMSGKTKL